MNTVEDCAHTEAEFDSFGSMPNNSGHNLLPMFTSFGKQKNLFKPSAETMRIAQERARRWAAEDGALLLDPQDDTQEQTPDVAVFPRQALQSVENVSPRDPSTSLMASGSGDQNEVASCHTNVAYNVVDLPSAEGGAIFRSAAHFSTPSTNGSRSFQTPSTSGMAGNAFMKPFKSPRLNRRPTSRTENSHTPSLFNTAAFTPTKGPKAVALDSFSAVGNASRSGFFSYAYQRHRCAKCPRKSLSPLSSPECDRVSRDTDKLRPDMTQKRSMLHQDPVPVRGSYHL